jgi:hypothetical protein
MTTLVFFLEELSAQVMLESFLPKFLPEGFDTKFIVFEGKSDLNKRLEAKIKNWQNPDCKFIVLRDQDSSNCIELKESLRNKCSKSKHENVLIRIACHELESWYLGDLQAVEQGLSISGISKLQTKAKYRSPDTIEKPAEELIKITKKKYQKVSGSREIGKYLNTNQNNSASFVNFVKGIQRIAVI